MLPIGGFCTLAELAAVAVVDEVLAVAGACGTVPADEAGLALVELEAALAVAVGVAVLATGRGAGRCVARATST